MDQLPPQIWTVAHTLVARNETNSTTSTHETSRPPVYKAIGISLAVASGVFIGTSFVLKKTGLLKANAKYNEEAGEGYGYLKNWFWWSGMTLMIVGEICNFVAYAFVDAILVTPLGALSVVITTILSAIFLKERLSFVGKVGCFNCIIGSVVIVLNAPEQSSVADIQEMQHFVISPGFLSYAGVVIVVCTFVALWAGPRYGKKSMLVYLSICSLIGGLSVVATQGLGSAVVAQASGKPQFNQWFLYVLLVFVVATLLTEIIYLNKALNLFNAALVTPTYYVLFTSATIVTSAILFRGFKGTAVTITTVILGFLQICSGVVLLQMSKSAKDVPDAAVFRGDLNQVREIAEVEQPESEPKADALRGAASLIRRISVSRQKMEQEEARRLREDTMKDQLEPLGENEVVEWDGLRRRKTILGQPGASPVPRRKSTHPPLGMSHFPPPDEDETNQGPGFFENLRKRAQTVIRHSSPQDSETLPHSPLHPVALTDIKVQPSHVESPIMPYGPGSLEDAQERIYGLPAGGRKEIDSQAGIYHSPRSKPLPAKPSPSPALRPPHETRRQFSFTNLLRPGSRSADADHEASRSITSHEQKRALKNATEEERLGLVKGDSHLALLQREISQSPERPHQSNSYFHPISHSHSHSSSSASLDGYYHDQYPSPSHSDEDDGWQMTNVPIVTNLTSPAPASVRSSTRRRPSPPRTFLPPPTMNISPQHNQERPIPVPGTMVGSGPTQAKAIPVVSGLSQTSLTSQKFRSEDQIQNSGSLQGRGNHHLAQTSEGRGLTGEGRFMAPIQRETEDDYEASRRRFEEQSKREREARRQRATGRRQSWKPTTPEVDNGSFI
ncbi:hypothetical protein A1O1_08269 [Capronia coronata CBS 617.96]|uniref:Magnesium transporter NIPA n=1 Tax=Capronia coronata CBS 617.96 TaxID=1182541 RepID=W9XHX8_9EURO|nr:uncharacterized protein A1O1_08269 [Capronia coronata CBS 617.96]EXJ80127.1 hypothetical protein A1O1_08269 [Capronia coronata CBS 617.96]